LQQEFHLKWRWQKRGLQENNRRMGLLQVLLLVLCLPQLLLMLLL
jgi:hypothetical protein